MTERIDHPEVFLRQLGDLHDVTISLSAYDSADGSVSFATPDLNWNFEGLPEYAARPCTIVLRGVSAFRIEAQKSRFHTSILTEGCVIARAYAVTVDGVSRMEIRFATGEQWYVEFEEMSVRDEVPS